MLISPCLEEPLYVGALAGRSPHVGGASPCIGELFPEGDAVDIRSSMKQPHGN